MPEEYDGQERSYLGQGLAFPLQLSVQGGLQLSSAAQKVKESIWIILRTSLGERMYRPDSDPAICGRSFGSMGTAN
jgi:uncharacterized protein